jgi:hypothetical protein
MNKTSEFIKLGKEGKLPEATLVKMSEFKDQLGRVRLTKTARDTAPATKVLLTALALGAGSTLAAMGVDAIYEKYLDKQKLPAFKKMLEYHPELKERDPKLVARYFDSVWHFSPHLATDPLAAGSYIRTAMNFHETTGGPPLNTAVDLTSLEKNVGQNRNYQANPIQGVYDKVNIPTIDL